mmetsp:Transcript_49693/g.155494  ORF Transcript_49693/g.155494 Transcript_49693/m.155494 type:complete len:271 (-) Transcript_49693:303-1115(-)
MVRPRDCCITEAVTLDLLFAGLHTHLHERHEDAVSRHLDLRLAHNKPLARGPVRPIHVGEVVAALHPNHGLLVLAHGELLQVHVGLEHHLSDARARQPLRLEALHLPLRMELIRRVCLAAKLGVEGEHGIPAAARAHLEGQGQVLQVDCGCRIGGGSDRDGVGGLIQGQAAHAFQRHVATAQLGGRPCIERDHLHLPADPVLLATSLLRFRVLLLTCLLLLLGLLQHELGLALSVHQRPAGIVVQVVGQLPYWQVALRAPAGLGSRPVRL